jgi:hypothetical protein
MKLKLEWEFSSSELAAIAAQNGREQADEDEARSFAQHAIGEAVKRAMVEYEATQNDPSTAVGP